jgi:hypothetical protein
MSGLVNCCVIRAGLSRSLIMSALPWKPFSQVFKAKCINHSFGLDANKHFNDFPVAPGYVLLAVIPDLNRLKASEFIGTNGFRQVYLMILVFISGSVLLLSCG